MGSRLSIFYLPEEDSADIQAALSVLKSHHLDFLPPAYRSRLANDGAIASIDEELDGLQEHDLSVEPGHLVQCTLAGEHFQLELSVGSLQEPLLFSLSVSMKSWNRLSEEQRERLKEMLLRVAIASGCWAAVFVLDPADDFLGKIIEADREWFFDMSLDLGPSYDPAWAWLNRHTGHVLHMRNLQPTGLSFESFEEFREHPTDS